MSYRSILKETLPAVLFAALVFCAAAEARAGAMKEEVGVVTSVSGRWYADGVQLKEGQRLTAGAVIKAKEPNVKYARVVVMLLDYREVSRVCDRNGLCGGPLVLPEAVNLVARVPPAGPPGFWERFVDALTLSRRRPARKTLARGGGGFRGEVVKLEDGRIELSGPLAARVRRYSRVRIVEAGPEGEASPGGRINLVSLKRGAGRRVVLDARGFTPGLYNMTFEATPARGIPPRPLEVLAFVAGPREYSKAAQDFGRARSLSARWDDAKEGADDFLREFLQSLAAGETR